jgi:hypothetical protein
MLLLLMLLVPDLAEFGHLQEKELREVSGIVASRRHEGVFWVHNDSGNPNDLYAISLKGKVLRQYRMPFLNTDWEDIALDAKGRLYLGDTGNNGHALPIRVVHRFDEPNPDGPRGEVVTKVTACYYRFPAGRRFDSEGMFVEGETVFLVTKRLDGKEAEIYSLEIDPPSTLLSPKMPKFVGKLPEFKEPATGADLTPDGKLLAVCANRALRVYGRDGEGGLTLVGAVRYKERQVEAIAWQGMDLILTDEGGHLFRVARREWQGAK